MDEIGWVLSGRIWRFCWRWKSHTKVTTIYNLIRWIIIQSRGCVRKSIGKVNRFLWEYAYLVLTSQVQPRSIKIGNSVSAVNAQQFFKSTFNALINEDYSIGVDIDRYQNVLEHALSNVEFLIGTGVSMLLSNLNLSIVKTTGYNNKIWISTVDIKIGSNRGIKLRYTIKNLPNLDELQLH